MSEALLELAVEILGPLVDDVVFVGGATIHLWITEHAAPPVRATDDVDVICDVTSYSEYQALAERLRERGLEGAINENVICRWRHRDSGLAIDVMPTAEDVLGFSNPWYELGIETAIERTFASGATIRAVAPPVVIATKLAAWRGRGHNDVLRSLDIHTSSSSSTDAPNSPTNLPPKLKAYAPTSQPSSTHSAPTTTSTTSSKTLSLATATPRQREQRSSQNGSTHSSPTFAQPEAHARPSASAARCTESRRSPGSGHSAFRCGLQRAGR